MVALMCTKSPLGTRCGYWGSRPSGNCWTDGKSFPAVVLQQIIAKTDGVPLFVEEITKSLLESGQLKAVDGYYELIGSLRALTIPATLQDSLMARLDRFGTAKGIAQLA